MVMATVMYAMIGLVAGLFVNLGADLLPRSEPLRRALICPHCGNRRPELRWPACLGFLLAPLGAGLARRCRHCGAPRPWRALVVELMMAGLFAYAWSHFGPSPRLWLVSLHTVVFALIFVIDLEHRLVLNRVVLGGTVLALAGSLLWGRPPLAQALLGGLSGFAIFLFIALAKPGGMGMGDVKLAGLIGLVIGFPGVLVALFMGIMAGGVGALALLLSRRAQRGSYLPYAPFLVTGALVALLGSVHW